MSCTIYFVFSGTSLFVREKNIWPCQKKFVCLQSINNKNLNVMKQLNYLFLNCCLFLGAVFAAVPSVAQTNSIYEVQSLFPQDAIVRYWQEEKYVVYSIDDNTMTHFTLFDYSSMQCTDFRIKGIEVSDFEIEKKTVYFCGKPAGGANPLFGYFDISTLFATGTGFYVASLAGAQPSLEFPGYYEEIISLMKLEVQTCPDGIHVYMIGEAKNTKFSATNRCIVDVMGTPPTVTWNVFFSQENASVYYYDDIAVTDNEVVVIGHKNGSAGHYNTSYPKPSFVLIPLIPFGYLATYYYSGWGSDYYLDPNRPLLIEHLFGDYYAIVGHANVWPGGILDRGTVVSIYNSSANCVYRCCIPQGFSDTAKWEFKDLRYNKHTERLYLLQEMSQPVSTSLNSVVCAFDVTSAGTIPSATAYYEPDVEYYSLDQAINVWDAVVVGEKTAMRLWHHEAMGDCVKKVQLPLGVLSTYNDYMGYYQYPVHIDARANAMSGALTSYSIDLICE